MKANEFVKKFGWEYAKHILTDDAPLVMGLNYTNLKRYVDSYELVESYGGLEQCKNLLIYCPPPLQVDYSDLKQAIEDMESCK